MKNLGSVGWEVIRDKMNMTEVPQNNYNLILISCNGFCIHNIISSDAKLIGSDSDDAAVLKSNYQTLTWGCCLAGQYWNGATQHEWEPACSCTCYQPDTSDSSWSQKPENSSLHTVYLQYTYILSYWLLKYIRNIQHLLQRTKISLKGH